MKFIHSIEIWLLTSAINLNFMIDFRLFKLNSGLLSSLITLAVGYSLPLILISIGVNSIHQLNSFWLQHSFSLLFSGITFINCLFIQPQLISFHSFCSNNHNFSQTLLKLVVFNVWNVINAPFWLVFHSIWHHSFHQF